MRIFQIVLHEVQILLKAEVIETDFRLALVLAPVEVHGIIFVNNLLLVPFNHRCTVSCIVVHARQGRLSKNLYVGIARGVRGQLDRGPLVATRLTEACCLIG